jgi:hypothetical protein
MVDICAIEPPVSDFSSCGITGNAIVPASASSAMLTSTNATPARLTGVLRGSAAVSMI